jgi:hypothetical protein
MRQRGVAAGSGPPIFTPIIVSSASDGDVGSSCGRPGILAWRFVNVPVIDPVFTVTTIDQVTF